MGTGKTSIGSKLSKKLSRKFFDSDHEMESRTGATISLIFEIEGEAGFRAREARLLAELTLIPNIVLATGGGVILHQKNRQILKQRGIVIYLKSGIDKLKQRISKDRNRPLLQNTDPAEMLEKLLAERSALYEETADLVIDTDGLSADDIMTQIIARQQ